MDENLKQDFDAVCAEMGLSMTAAFTVFAKTVTKNRVIPFEISADRLPSDITLASEKALAKDWLLPEEDEAWANL
jgi:DNA-damage-inducible protein J